MRVSGWSVLIVFGAWIGIGPAVATAQTVPPPDNDEATKTGFSVDRIYGGSGLSGHLTAGIAWTPDGKSVSYFTDLAGGEAKKGRRKELWEMEATTGETKLLSAVPLELRLTAREREILLAGGLIAYARA